MLVLLALPAGATAAPQLVELGQFVDPVALAAPPRDPSRLFVVQRGGVIRLIEDGVTVPAPFADLSGHVQEGGEQGLLGMAFPPDHAASGLLYVFLVPPGGGAIEIRELQRSGDPDRAMPGPGRLVLSVPHTQDVNHNAGQLAFGPDGFLYAATGDGGGSNDLEDDAARTDRLLGKILRIDPRALGGKAYVVPPSNPFGNEVWAYGLRNPWRFSFDRATGDLVIGDVGQGVKEEVDWAPAAAGGGRGVNFGWHCWEGTIPTPRNPNDRGSAPLCTAGQRPVAQAPALERDHVADGFCAIVGGFVVRDPGLPTLAGRYLFGDNCHAGLQSAVLGGPDAPVETGLAVTALTSFGEDACGRIYAASLDGAVMRLQDGPPSACSSSPAPAPAPAAAAPRRCALAVGYRRTQRTLRGRGRLRLALRAGEPCRARLEARRFRSRTVTLRAGVKRVVRLTPPRKGLRRLRRALRPGRRGVRVTVRIAARDAAGNLSVRKPRVKLRR